MTATNALDYSILGVYLLGLAGLTYYHSRRVTNDATNYFLAHRDTKWFAVGASFFASNIGSDSIIGLSSAGATVGIAAGFFDFASPVMFLLLAYLFLPIFMRQSIFTMPEYTEQRFGSKMRVYLAIIALLVYIISRVSASLFCGAIIIEATLGLNMWTAVICLLVFTGIFTMIGGLSAIIHVEVINTVLLVIGGSITTVLVMHAVGGWSGLKDSLQNDPAAADAGMDVNFMRMYQTSGPYSWSGLIFGAPWLMMWFHCTEQEMVQRGLAGKNLSHSQTGSIMAGYLKLTIPFAWCLPGIAARFLYPDDLNCPEHGECSDANKAFPVVMSHLMPNGVYGLMIAAMLAAILSVLASTFNSASTIFAMDIFKRLKPTADSATLVKAGRIWVVVMTALGIAWIPILSHLDDSLYVAMQSINAMLGPPIASIFLLGVVWPRATEQGALTGLLIGHIPGILRLLWTAASPDGNPHESSFTKIFIRSTFLHFGAVMAVVSMFSAIAVSLFTRSPHMVDNAACTARSALRIASKFGSRYKQEYLQALEIATSRQEVQEEQYAQADIAQSGLSFGQEFTKLPEHLGALDDNLHGYEETPQKHMSDGSSGHSTDNDEHYECERRRQPDPVNTKTRNYSRVVSSPWSPRSRRASSSSHLLSARGDSVYQAKLKHRMDRINIFAAIGLFVATIGILIWVW